MKRERRHQGKVTAGRRAVGIGKEEPEEALPTGCRDTCSDEEGGAAKWALPEPGAPTQPVWVP